MDGHTLDCPDCGSPLGPRPGATCPHCGLPLQGPDAAELWQVDTAIARIDVHRAALLRRRQTLLAGLRARRDSPPPAAPAQAVPTSGASPFTGTERRREVSASSAQTLLLILGVLLVALAGLAFTVVNWGRLGIGGRTAVLAVLTVLALALPIPLRRRHLTATAEAAAVIGLALALLDCHAARATGLAGSTGVPEVLA